MPENSKIDFYNREKRFNSSLAKIGNWCKTEANKQLIFRLLSWAQAKDISYARRCKYLYFLKYMAQWLNKNLDKVTKDDIIFLVGKINSHGFTSETKSEFKAIIKKFYDVTLYDKNKQLVDWLYDRRNDIIKRKVSFDVRKKREKLTKEDIAKLIYHSDIRMKAFISVMFESCCRPSELLACRISDLQPTKEGFRLNLPQSKTKVRSILLFESSQYIISWLNIHPNKNNNSFLFCTDAINNKGEKWSPYGSLKQLKLVAKKANINKEITNYGLRRSGFTYKITVKKISTSSMEIIMGWSKGNFAKRAKDYDLNTQEDAENELRQAYGIISKEEIKDLDNKKCLRCSEDNSFAEKYCKKCAAALDPEVIAQIETKQILYEKLWEKLIDFVDVKKLEESKDALELMKLVRKV